MNREDIIRFITEHKTEFEQEFSVTRIGLFGSYARGEVHEESDIDITKNQFDDATKLAEEVSRIIGGLKTAVRKRNSS